MPCSVKSIFLQFLVKPGFPLLAMLLWFSGTGIAYATNDQNASENIVTHEVILQKMRFIPEVLTIREGDKVRWINREKRQYHNVWFEALGEDEPDYLFPGDQYEKYFYQQGEYAYRCGPHPLMLGKIIVEPRHADPNQQSSSAASHQKNLSEARQEELLYLLKQDCGSCHGMRLMGGLGPSLLPADIAAATVEDLMSVILEGRPGTAMPPWKALINEVDARWLSQTLKSGGALE